MSWRMSAARLRRLLSLGTPAAVQILLEAGVFTVVTVLAGQLVPAALAAHQIALNWAATAFMVPLGVSSAAAVRVGHAIGRRDPAGATRAGWTALLLGVLFMSAAAVTFVAAPRPLLRMFTDEATVIQTGVSLLAVAALFQLFDGVQVVATGVLRGLGDTRTPMLWNLVGHWAIGLPLGWWLCFREGWGVAGLWVGLLVGLLVVGTVLLKTWSGRSRAMLSAGGLPLDAWRAAPRVSD
jgi:MATE family multidrug resistance protein